MGRNGGPRGLEFSLVFLIGGPAWKKEEGLYFPTSRNIYTSPPPPSRPPDDIEEGAAALLCR